MIGSIVTIAVFTASVTSTLTIKHLQGAVHGVSDLATVRVGAIAGTSTEDTFSRLRINYRQFATLQEGLDALRARKIDAFVYDKPLLAWAIQQSYSSSLELLDAAFDSQQYAFALPTDSPHRKALDVAVLDAIHSGWWEQTHLPLSRVAVSLAKHALWSATGNIEKVSRHCANQATKDHTLWISRTLANDANKMSIEWL